MAASINPKSSRESPRRATASTARQTKLREIFREVDTQKVGIIGKEELEALKSSRLLQKIAHQHDKIINEGEFVTFYDRCLPSDEVQYATATRILMEAAMMYRFKMEKNKTNKAAAPVARKNTFSPAPSPRVGTETSQEKQQQVREKALAREKQRQVEASKKASTNPPSGSRYERFQVQERRSPSPPPVAKSRMDVLKKEAESIEKMENKKKVRSDAKLMADQQEQQKKEEDARKQVEKQRAEQRAKAERASLDAARSEMRDTKFPVKSSTANPRESSPGYSRNTSPSRSISPKPHVEKPGTQQPRMNSKAMMDSSPTKEELKALRTEVKQGWEKAKTPSKTPSSRNTESHGMNPNRGAVPGQRGSTLSTSPRPGYKQDHSRSRSISPKPFSSSDNRQAELEAKTKMRKQKDKAEKKKTSGSPSASASPKRKKESKVSLLSPEEQRLAKAGY